MESIRIGSCFPQNVTVIPNDFLDRYLPEANGDFLKIFLYMLRIAGSGKDAFSPGGVADHLNYTENDVLRAIRYWEKAGALQVVRDAGDRPAELSFFPAPAAAEEPEPEVRRASDITSERMQELGSREEVRQSFYVAQQYIGRPLTRSEMQKICYFYDSLRFSADLIDYLIEYCVSRGHKSFHYIEKVALNWKDQGIATIRDARLSEGSYHREYYDILKALGIDNHHPVEAEIRIMKKWLERYGFSMELIREACTRTVMGASKPTLNYADGILSRWHQAGAATMEDVRRLDEEHEKAKTARRDPEPAGRAAPRRTKKNFSNFEERDYDFGALESRLLEKQIISTEEH